MRDVLNKYVFFKVKNVIRDMKDKQQGDISCVVAKDGYLSGDSFNIYIVSNGNKVWVDHAKREGTANKKLNRINEIIEYII